MEEVSKCVLRPKEESEQKLLTSVSSTNPRLRTTWEIMACDSSRFERGGRG